MRYDSGDFRPPVVTPNGYLRCDARITKVGVFDYRLADGSVRRELRLPEEVFKADSLATFNDVPLTNGHPREKLDARNTRKYQAGVIGSVGRQGEHVGARVLVTDAAAIKDAQSGKRQLSCGYDCDLEDRAGVTSGIDGVPDGLRYDAIQRNIVGNHVALVTTARAGTTAALHLDADDAVMVDQTATKPEPTGPLPGTKQGQATMGKVRIDGVDYEVDETAAQAVTKVLARLDELGDKIAAAEKLAAELKARADKADEDLEAEKKARADDASDDKVRAAVKARVALETTASKILAGDDLKLDDMAELDVKRAVVVKVSPSAKDKLEDADDTYVNARFDAAVETWQAAQDAKPSASAGVRGAAAVSNQRMDSASARQRMIERNQNMGTEPIRPTTLNA